MADKRAFDALGGRFAAPVGDEQVCVSIPVYLIPHILGALEPLRWPDLWEGEPSAINQVTGVVEELFRSLISREQCNVPDCPGCPDCPDCPDTRAPTSGVASNDYGLGEEWEMPCLDLTNLIKIEGGVLYVRDSCCEWHAVGQLTGLVGELGADVPGALLPEGSVYSACGKATHVVDMIYRVVAGFFDAANELPTQWVGTVEGYVPGYNLSNTHIANGVIEALKLNLILAEPAVTAVQVRYRVLCELSQRLNATAALSDDEWGVLKNAWFSQLGILDLIFVTAIAALGRGNLTNIAKLGVVDVDAICPCEAFIDPAETGPDANGWYLSINYADTFTQWAESNTTWNTAISAVLPVHDTYGSFLVVQSSPNASTIKRMAMTEILTDEAALPAYDVSVWGNTSDHLENINQNFPLISRTSIAIQTALAAQRGYAGYVDGGTTGIDSNQVANPEGLGGEVHAARFHYPNTVTYGNQFRVIEYRLIHNVNSPSHS